MKVYIAMSNDWSRIVGVYTTREEAKKAIQIARWSDVMAGGYSSFWVDECEVQERFEDPYRKK